MRAILFDHAPGSWALAIAVLGLAACQPPAPIPLGPYQTTPPGYSTRQICEAARTAPLTSSCALLITDPGCVAATCSKYLYYPVAKITNANSFVGNACFAVEPASPGAPVLYSYSCVKSAACQCSAK